MGKFDLATSCLEKSLRHNPTDSDTLALYYELYEMEKSQGKKAVNTKASKGEPESQSNSLDSKILTAMDTKPTVGPLDTKPLLEDDPKPDLPVDNKPPHPMASSNPPTATGKHPIRNIRPTSKPVPVPYFSDRPPPGLPPTRPIMPMYGDPSYNSYSSGYGYNDYGTSGLYDFPPLGGQYRAGPQNTWGNSAPPGEFPFFLFFYNEARTSATLRSKASWATFIDWLALT